jgi:tetratricopeptide (TPR) repeat protein
MAAALLLAALSGCAYFNGMYNARRAAREAQGFARQGRTAEARDRWLRAVLHAESLVARHPHSRWVPDALLLSGFARVQSEDFSGAAVALDRAVRAARSDAQRAEALALLGRTDVGLGQPADALPLLDSAFALSPRARADALLWRGIALRRLGRFDEAVAALDRSTAPQAPFERARTLLQLRDTSAALAALDGLTGHRPFEEAAWRGVLDTLGDLGARASASRLAERLASRRDVPRGARARLLLDDGGRQLAAGDTAGARARFDEAALAAGDSVEGRIVAVRLTLLALPGAGDDEALDTLRSALERAVAQGGAPAVEAQPMARRLARARALLEDGPLPDARWFLRAELLRDSVGARPLAARAFAEMGRRYPDSPWTPKALLAAVAAGYPAADSLRRVLDGRYRDSPYRRAALGLAGASEGYALLEDSLSRALAGVDRTGRAAPEGAGAAPGGRPVAAPRPSGARPDTADVAPSPSP